MSLEPLDRLLRPASPPAELRERVLSAAGAAARDARLAELDRSRGLRRLEWAWRLATALALLGHLWVSFASERFDESLRNRFAAANFRSISLPIALDAE